MEILLYILRRCFLLEHIMDQVVSCFLWILPLVAPFFPASAKRSALFTAHRLPRRRPAVFSPISEGLFAAAFIPPSLHRRHCCNNTCLPHAFASSPPPSHSSPPNRVSNAAALKRTTQQICHSLSVSNRFCFTLRFHAAGGLLM